MMPEGSERAVATMGSDDGVIVSRWRAKVRPMLRDAGVTRAQAIVEWWVGL